jgi:D-3-phosphoglycerate dehydrogenase
MNHAGKILITEQVDQLLIDGLTSMGFECDMQPGISQQDVIESIYHYTGIVIATRISVKKDILDRASSLKFIARAGSGMENIDVEYAAFRKVVCINSPEGNANSVGEHAIALLLDMFHNVTRSAIQTRGEEWLVEENRVHELEGRTIAIIGYGNTGKAFAKKLQPFGMKVLAYDKYLVRYGDEFVEEASMERIQAEATIISFHIPQTAETLWIADEPYFSSFIHPLHILNTSRGKIIRHSGLLQAICNGRVLQAALDVFENEDFSSQTPEERTVFRELLNTQKVLFTPHIAGKSFESKRKIAATLLQKISTSI